MSGWLWSFYTKLSPGCLINQNLSFGTCQYGGVCGWRDRPAWIWTLVRLWGLIDGVKVIIRLWMSTGWWVKRTCSHWSVKVLLLSSMPIPADPRSVQMAGLNPAWPFHWPLRWRGGFYCHCFTAGVVEKLGLNHTKGLGNGYVLTTDSSPVKTKHYI